MCSRRNRKQRRRADGRDAINVGGCGAVRKTDRGCQRRRGGNNSSKALPRRLADKRRDRQAAGATKRQSAACDRRSNDGPPSGDSLRVSRENCSHTNKQQTERRRHSKRRSGKRLKRPTRAKRNRHDARRRCRVFLVYVRRRLVKRTLLLNWRFFHCIPLLNFLFVCLFLAY